MKVGVHVHSFTWPGGPHRLAQDLTRAAQAAEDNGFDKLSVMDHLWQVARNGPPEHEMLQAARPSATSQRERRGSGC